MKNLFMTKEEKIEAKAAYKAAKSEMKAATKRYKRATRARRLIILAVCMVLMTIFASAFADTVPAKEVEEMKQQIKVQDVVALPDTAVLGNPNETQAYSESIEAWKDGDNSRILFFGLNHEGFQNVALNHEGDEVTKIQVCVIESISGDQITCTAPDGNCYTVTNEYGNELGDSVVLAFLLAAEPDAA